MNGTRWSDEPTSLVASAGLEGLIRLGDGKRLQAQSDKIGPRPTSTLINTHCHGSISRKLYACLDAGIARCLTTCGHLPPLAKVTGDVIGTLRVVLEHHNRVFERSLRRLFEICMFEPLSRHTSLVPMQKV